HVPGGLRNIDANEDAWSFNERTVHGRNPILRMRAGRRRTAAALASVRANSKRPATILLLYGVVGAQRRTICRRPRRGVLRSTPRRLVHWMVQSGLCKHTRGTRKHRGATRNIRELPQVCHLKPGIPEVFGRPVVKPSFSG